MPYIWAQPYLHFLCWFAFPDCAVSVHKGCKDSAAQCLKVCVRYIFYVRVCVCVYCSFYPNLTDSSGLMVKLKVVTYLPIRHTCRCACVLCSVVCGWRVRFPVQKVQDKYTVSMMKARAATLPQSESAICTTQTWKWGSRDFSWLCLFEALRFS